MKHLELRLKRFDKKEDLTFGKLYIDNVFFCYTLEDEDRGITDKMTDEDIRKIKVKSETACLALRRD